MDFTGFNTPMPRYLRAIEITDEKWANMVKFIAQTIKQYEPDFIWNEELRHIYKNILLYFVGSSDSIYDLEKGLYIHGDCGSGKSLILEIVFKVFTSHLACNSYRVIPSIELGADIQKNGHQCVKNYVCGDNGKPIIAYFDDFGAGSLKVNNWGTVIDPFSEIIMQRFPYLAREGALTHFSSNIRPSEFKDRFDDRVASRMAKMVNTIKMPAADYRRLNLKNNI